MAPLIGILALQGDFAAHARKFQALGAEIRFVKRTEDLAVCGALVLPGGESTTMLRLLDAELRQALSDRVQGGLPLYATCAGLILIAQKVTNPPQDSLGLVDVAVTRNGYGRQVDSFRTDELELSAVGRERLGADKLGGVFIRAPLIESLGDGVETLARWGGHPVLVQSGNILGATFHPELGEDDAVERCFLKMLVYQRLISVCPTMATDGHCGTDTN